MSDVTTDAAPAKKSKMPLILGLVLAIAGGGGGFFAVSSGMIGASKGDESQAEDEKVIVEDMPAIAFVPLDPMIVSLPSGGVSTHLRFSAQLEVNPEHVAEVETLKPRIVDVLNGYLRAVEIAELSDPAVLVKLRGQMLRRVQVVVGDGRVRDLLIMEFVMN